jgi:hypothetical protein
LDERLGFGEPITQQLRDSRRGKNTHSVRRPVPPVRAQPHRGYEDVNGAERLAQDPKFRVMGRTAASRDALAVATG